MCFGASGGFPFCVLASLQFLYYCYLPSVTVWDFQWPIQWCKSMLRWQGAVYQEQQENVLQKHNGRQIWINMAHKLFPLSSMFIVMTCSCFQCSYSFSLMSLMNAVLTSVWMTASGTWGLNILCSGSSGSIPLNSTRWVHQKQQSL